jgi:HK97 family phage prohead protease
MDELIGVRAGITVDEVRSLLGGERRWTGALALTAAERVEARSSDADDDAAPAPGELRISGYSAVFDSPSERLYGFMVERVKRGAFKRVLADEALDVRLLENHEGRPYARTTNGTLKLTEKPRGLFRDAVLDARRQDARDLYHAIERGDYTQSSFAFTVARDEWRTCGHADADDYAGCDCIWERDILEVGSLVDDTIATYPAYPASSATVARESERSGERAAPASDDEQRDTASDTDTSPSESVSDHNAALLLRQWIAIHGGMHDVDGPEGGA